MGSVEETPLSHLGPSLLPSTHESPLVQTIVKSLGLLSHIEGGYFNETDRTPITIPSPYPEDPVSAETLALVSQRPGFDPKLRTLSSSIYYYITPKGPIGYFHRNRCRIIHSLHKGRGRYVVIHPDGKVDSFVVGHDVAKGERLQWVVEGGAFKASFLLPDRDGEDGTSEGLLISEVAVPGFEYCDHDFLTPEKIKGLVDEKTAKELEWLVRKG